MTERPLAFPHLEKTNRAHSIVSNTVHNLPRSTTNERRRRLLWQARKTGAADQMRAVRDRTVINRARTVRPAQAAAAVAAAPAHRTAPRAPQNTQRTVRAPRRQSVSIAGRPATRRPPDLVGTELSRPRPGIGTAAFTPTRPETHHYPSNKPTPRFASGPC